MLEGLEIREYKLSDCIQNKDYRIDTDYYIKIPPQNRNLEYKKIGDCLLYSQYGISIEMNEESKGYPIYRMNEIHDMLCDLDVDKCADIEEDVYESFQLNDKDVLFNRTNSYDFVGRTGIYYDNDGVKRTFASYLVKFVPKTNIILPEYLTTYLNIEQGIQDIKRHARQSINQTNVNPEEVKDMYIPILSMSFQEEIKDCLVMANDLRCQSDSLFKSIETFVANELELNNIRINKENKSIVTFHDSFTHSSRFDAEYYLPEYDDYSSIINTFKNGKGEIHRVCSILDNNFTPVANQRYKYIELSNIGDSGNITGYTECEGQELPTRARRIVKEGDVIVSSIEGSLSSCALVTNEYNGALCSTGFYVVRSSYFNPEALLMLFKSEPIQKLMKKGCSGTILTAISKNEFEKIPLPLIASDIQDQIATQVQESFRLRRESKHLLEITKKAVEIAISENEEKALLYIIENTNGKSLYN